MKRSVPLVVQYWDVRCINTHQRKHAKPIIPSGGSLGLPPGEKAQCDGDDAQHRENDANGNAAPSVDVAHVIETKGDFIESLKSGGSLESRIER